MIFYFYFNTKTENNCQTNKYEPRPTIFWIQTLKTVFESNHQTCSSASPQERQFNNKTREILIQRGKQQTKGKGNLDLTRVKTKERQGRSRSLWSPNSFLLTLHLYSQIWMSDAKSWSFRLRKGPNFNTNHLEKFWWSLKMERGMYDRFVGWSSEWWRNSVAVRRSCIFYIFS